MGNDSTGTSWASGTANSVMPWNQFVVGMGLVLSNTGVHNTITHTGSGWTQETAYQNVAGASSSLCGVSGYKTVNGSASSDYTGTAASSALWGAVTAMFLIPTGETPFAYQPAWGGYVFNEHSSYTGVSATFTVPSSMPAVSQNTALCSVWVGLGNINQIGIYLGYNASYAGSVYTSPWSWWIAGAGETWDYNSYPAHGGDSLTLGMNLDGSYWNMTMTNSTRSWSYTEKMAVLATNLNSWNISGGTASTPSWIYPLNQAVVIIEKEASELADYVSIPFTRVSTTPAAGSAPYPVFTVNAYVDQYPGPYSLSGSLLHDVLPVPGLMPVISYSIGSTPINAEASTVTVPAPPAYSAGDFLVMSVIGGSESGTGVAPSTPSGWTALTGGGAAMGVFWKTAGSEPASYTVTMAASCTAAAWVAAYPAASISSSSFAHSSGNVTSWSPSVPGGVSSDQLLLVAGGAVPSAGAVKVPVGNANFNFPAGLTPEVPAFAPSNPTSSNGPYTAAAGLSDVAGSDLPGSLTFTSAQQSTLYAGFIVLTVTGTSDPLAVTATVASPEGTPGLALTVKALSGAASPGAIAAGGAKVSFYASGTSQAPQTAITPNAAGSLVYGAVTENYGVTGGADFTANAATTFCQNIADTAWNAIYGTFRSQNTTTNGVPVTLGGSAPDNGYTVAALAEILAAAGQSLSETATALTAGTVPGDFATTSVAQTAIFTTAPAAGTLLVAMVSANSRFGDGNATVTITDTAGLTWVPLAEEHYPAYAGVWVALVQAPAAGVYAFVPGAAEPGAATPGVPGAPGSVTVTGVTASITVTAVPGTVTGGGGGGTDVTGVTARITVTAVPGTVRAAPAVSAFPWVPGYALPGAATPAVPVDLVPPPLPVSPVTVLQTAPGSALAPAGIGTTPITTLEGSFLACFLGWNTDTPGGVIPLPAVNVTDSAGNLWQQAAISTPGSAPTRCAVWVAPNALPVTWVSAGLTGFAASAAWTVAEITGMPQAASVDFCVSTSSLSGAAPSLSWTAAEPGIGLAVTVAADVPETAAAPGAWKPAGTAAAGSASSGCSVFGYVNGSIIAGSATTALALGTAAAFSYALCSLSAAASPPPQANLNFPGVTVQAAFGAAPGAIRSSADYLFSSEYTVWTDITSRVIGPAVQGRIKVKRGRPYQLQQQETGTAEIPLSNVDGAATPTNPGSPWYSNALNANMSFQSGVSPWGVQHGASLTQSAAVTFASGLNAVAMYSAQVTCGAASSPGIVSELVPVNQNYPYSVSAWLYTAVAWSGGQAGVNWYDSSGMFISSAVSPAEMLPAGQWEQVTVTGLAPPSGAAYAQAVVQLSGTPGPGFTFYAAEAAVVTGPSLVRTGLVAPMVPVRVTAWWQGRQYPVWSGYAQQWPQEWPDMPQWGFSPLKCADALGAAAAGQMQSALIGEVLIDDPYAYLPCNESYTSQVNGATPANPFIFSGGYLEPADANALPAVNRAAGNQVTGTYVDGAGQQVSTGLAMNFLGDSGTGMGATGYGSAVTGQAGPAMLYTDPGLPAVFPGPASLEFWFTWAGTATQAATLLNAFGAPSAFWSTASGYGGILTVYANGSTLTTNTLSSSGSVNSAIVPSGSPQHYALIVTDGAPGFLAYINGTLAGSAASPLTIGPVSALALGSGRWSYDTNSQNASYYGYNYAAGHLAVYSYELSTSRIRAHYQAGATGWQGVSASTRFSQILTWAQLGLKRGGWSQASVTGQAEITQIGPAYDLSGQQASDAIYAVAQSEGGRYKVQANGSLIYLERDAGYNLPVSAVLSDGTAVAPAVLNADPGFATGLAGWSGGDVTYSPGNAYGSLGALSVTGTAASPSFSYNGGSANAGFWVQVPSGGTVTTTVSTTGTPSALLTQAGGYLLTQAGGLLLSEASVADTVLAAGTAAVSAGGWSFLPLPVPANSATSAFLTVSAGTAPFYLAYAAMWYSGGQVRYLPKQSYGYDTTYIYNEITATQQDGPNQLISYDARGTASQAQYFRRSALTFSPDVISAYDVSDITTWNLAGYQQPSLHVSAITVDAASNPLEAFPVALSLDTGQVALTSRHPVGGAPLAETGTVEQIGHVIGPGYWRTSCQLSPYGPAQAVLCADTAGFDAAGSALTLAW